MLVICFTFFIYFFFFLFFSIISTLGDLVLQDGAPSTATEHRTLLCWRRRDLGGKRKSRLHLVACIVEITGAHWLHSIHSYVGLAVQHEGDRPLSAASHRTMHGLEAVWKFSGWMTSAVRLCVASDGFDWADLILRASCMTCAMELRVSPRSWGSQASLFFGRFARYPGTRARVARDGQEDERDCVATVSSEPSPPTGVVKRKFELAVGSISGTPS